MMTNKSTEISIRRYKPSDKEAVYNLHKLALKAAGVWADRRHLPLDSYPKEWNDYDLDDIENNYLNGGEFLVGEINGIIVAMGGFRKKSADTAELKRMRVSPEFQRRGYAQIILTLLEKKAKEMGYKKLILDTTIRSVAAQKLYLKNGYKEIGKRKVEIFDTELLFYEKEL